MLPLLLWGKATRGTGLPALAVGASRAGPLSKGLWRHQGSVHQVRPLGLGRDEGASCPWGGRSFALLFSFSGRSAVRMVAVLLLSICMGRLRGGSTSQPPGTRPKITIHNFTLLLNSLLKIHENAAHGVEPWHPPGSGLEVRRHCQGVGSWKSCGNPGSLAVPWFGAFCAAGAPRAEGAGTGGRLGSKRRGWSFCSGSETGPGNWVTPQPHFVEGELRGHKSDFPQSQKGELRARTWPLPTFTAGRRGRILRQLSPALIASVLFFFV